MIKNVSQLRKEINIVDVISKYVEISKRGTVLVGLCPFHNEKSPSFTVYPTTGTYKCFGCGEGGDAVAFLMEHKGMTFPEAIESAASESRLVVEYEQTEKRQEVLDRAIQEKQRRDGMAETLHNVHHYYQQKGPQFVPLYCDLQTREEICNVDGRAVGRNTVNRFGICLAPDDNFVRKSAFWEDSILEEIGILGKGDFGLYDFFRNRLLFRIADNTGKIVGLGGRRPRAEDAANKRAKYINSKDSLLFQKKDNLFGLYENRKGIRDAGYAVLVEGYFDVVTPHDHGVCNHVAPCGTALTEQQARLLRRYTDEVVILRDGDDAGREAAKRDVEILIKAGLKVRIVNLRPSAELLKNIEEQGDAINLQKKEIEAVPEEDRKGKKYDKAVSLLKKMNDVLENMKGERDALKDPDIFVRRQGKESYIAYIQDNAEDALIWRVMCEYDKDDVFKKETAIQVAAQLLCLIESETLRDSYLRELTQKSRLGAVKSILASAISAQVDGKEAKNDLTPKQKQDIINYGIYIKDNKYFVSFDVGRTGWSVSNFSIKPIIFIEGTRESIRLVEITNEKGSTRILDINSKNFVELGPFKSTVEARGNYRFEGKPEHFAKLKAKVYDEMTTAFPIYTLGLHKEGFFAFANGILNEGKFSPVDEYGLVSHGDVRYYLPAYSKIREHIKSDDVENDYQDEQYYVYGGGSAPLSFHDWTVLMRQVHGENAIIGILYLCAALIRDKIFERLDNMFPHLNMFGLPGSGKNQLAASLCALFGKYRPPVHIVNATDAAFFRRIAQVRCGIAWYDEYSNNCDHRRIEALKQFADGTGRARAQVDNPNRTNSTAVNAACIMSGQQQPTADVALFTRCISLNFSNTEFSKEAKEKHARLKKLEQGGDLTAFTAALHALRPAICEQFALAFEESYTRFQALAAGSQVMDRIMRSYTALLTTYKLFSDKIQFGFTEKEVEDTLLKCILTQRDAVYQENETSIWWRMVEFFIANGEIEHGTDLLVEEVHEEVYDLDWKTAKEVKQYKPNRRLLYLYLARAHPLYLERHYRQRNVKGLDNEALKYYLKASPAWEGWKKSKKIGGAVKYVLVFDVDKLPFELEDTVAVLAKKNRFAKTEESEGAKDETKKPAESTVTTTVAESDIDTRLPF